MKIYYFTAIAVGLMFLLYIGGVATTSNNIIGFVGGNNPSGWESSGLWIAAAVAFLAFAGTSRLSIGGLTAQASVEFVIAGLIGALYVIFAGDLYSIVGLVGATSCPVGGALKSCGWEYWTIWGVIVPLMTAYTIALIEFIRGSD